MKPLLLALAIFGTLLVLSGCETGASDSAAAAEEVAKELPPSNDEQVVDESAFDGVRIERK